MSWVFHQIRRDGYNSHSFTIASHQTINNHHRDTLTQPILVPPPPPLSPSSSGARISPAVLFIIVILAVIFFISGLLHLLVRFLIKHPSSLFSTLSAQSGRYPPPDAPSDALQRQLQQLFHLHDSGLDQAFIDALPVFLYREIVGPKEPFDCAVCLCEFSDEDKLRLLPLCGHAFHLDCIDTWLLSNSTCPLCRGMLFVPGHAIENPVFYFDDAREENGYTGDIECGFPSAGSQKMNNGEEEIVLEKKVFPVRLGKFKRVIEDNSVEEDVGETSSSRLDARRCYSMGSYQYVVGELNLQVALRNSQDGRGGRRRGLNTNCGTDEELEGKRICAGSKGESFSVSKIWLWSNKKGKLPHSVTEASSQLGSLDVSSRWTERGRFNS
ncbi:RING-H2 finger protein ATL46 [Acorus calamus]|uniref:RING-type E3 ubiquitin transferase n=1 Tax=Acorus calamus TaxID=4465 RepID=A0AAV9D915_ACOCL|nr:RING-H2 finger protein ATL46 [Acorus calamus]